MFHAIGRLTSRFPVTICLGWLVLGFALTLVAPSWDTQTQDDDVCFVPDRFTSVRAYQLLSEAFPQDVSACRAVFAIERADQALSDADFNLVDDLVQDLDKLRQEDASLKIIKVESYKDPLIGCRLTSADRQCTLIQLNLGTPYLADATKAAVDRAQSRVESRVAKTTDAPRVYTTGAAGIGRDLTKAAGQSLEGTTWATIALVVVVLLGVYRAPLLALVPLVTIGISVWVSLKLLALMTMLPGVHLVNISKVFAIVILYGAGTDYCLFLISRYREELEKGQSLTEALVNSVGGVGLALAASAGTVMVGLGLMAMAEFAKVRYAGPAIALSLGVALIASMTLTPALLRLLGKTVFWPRRPPGLASDNPMMLKFEIHRPTIWELVSRRVAARPALTWAMAVAFLLPLVGLGLFVKPSYRATDELAQSSGSLRGLEAIQQHFSAGHIGPITILLASDSPWDSLEGITDIAHLSNGFSRLENVAEVRSVTQPLGWRPPDLNPDHFGDGPLGQLIVYIQPMLEEFRATMQHRAKEHYFAEVKRNGKPYHVTRLDIVLHSDPFTAESAATLNLLQTWLREELPRSSLIKSHIQSECFGITANAQDLAEVTESDRSRVNTLVLGAIFLILLGLVRRVWLAGYLLATVLASYYAALGATALMGFVWAGHLQMAVDWRVPFFLFTILVAVGEDYNILLVSRAIQERKKHGDYEGMRRALACTGGAITSCGLIMAGTFATLMLAGLNTLMQIGFALAFGVMIDTFVVRPFLVPAFCMMVWGDGKTGAKEGKADAMSKVLGPEWKNAA